MQARGHRVMTIAPRYDQYKDAWDTSTSVEVKAHFTHTHLLCVCLFGWLAVLSQRLSRSATWEQDHRTRRRLVLPSGMYAASLAYQQSSFLCTPAGASRRQDGDRGLLPHLQAGRGPRVCRPSAVSSQGEPVPMDPWNLLFFLFLRTLSLRNEVPSLYTTHRPWLDHGAPRHSTMTIDVPAYAQVWGKTGSKIYGPVTGTDYLDNQLRFSLFNQVTYLPSYLPCVQVLCRPPEL